MTNNLKFDKIIPIAKPDLPDFDKITPDLKDTFESGMVTNYKYVKRFEEAIAKYLRVKYAICVSTGTSGLMLAVRVLGLKGEVIIPSFTFSATAHSLFWNNLDIVFVDIDKESFAIDIDKIKEAITPRTSAIMPVHVFGNPCDIDKLQVIANKHNLKLIFDSAHAFGSSYKGKKIAGFGDIEVFSLTPTKTMTAVEGGIITTNNKEIYDQLVKDRVYGKNSDQNCQTIGLSARMPEFNAIIGYYNLLNLDKHIEKRKHLYGLYKKNLSDVEGISFQKLNADADCSMKDFAIVIDKEKFGIDRDELFDELEKRNIKTRKYFYPPVHRETAYEQLRTEEINLKNTDYISENILNLPFFASLKDDEVTKICDIIKDIKVKNE